MIVNWFQKGVLLDWQVLGIENKGGKWGHL